MEQAVVAQHSRTMGAMAVLWRHVDRLDEPTRSIMVQSYGRGEAIVVAGSTCTDMILREPLAHHGARFRHLVFEEGECEPTLVFDSAARGKPVSARRERALQAAMHQAFSLVKGLSWASVALPRGLA